MTQTKPACECRIVCKDTGQREVFYCTDDGSLGSRMETHSIQVVEKCDRCKEVEALARDMVAFLEDVKQAGLLKTENFFSTVFPVDALLARAAKIGLTEG